MDYNMYDRESDNIGRWYKSGSSNVNSSLGATIKNAEFEKKLGEKLFKKINKPYYEKISGSTTVETVKYKSY